MIELLWATVKLLKLWVVNTPQIFVYKKVSYKCLYSVGVAVANTVICMVAESPGPPRAEPTPWGVRQSSPLRAEPAPRAIHWSGIQGRWEPSWASGKFTTDGSAHYPTAIMTKVVEFSSLTFPIQKIKKILYADFKNTKIIPSHEGTVYNIPTQRAIQIPMYAHETYSLSKTHSASFSHFFPRRVFSIHRSQV